MAKKERWRPVPYAGYERYSVSDRGNVRGVTGRALTLTAHPTGYVYAALHNGRAHQKKVYVHRLVWAVFGGPLKRCCHIHHHNGFCDDNRIENLGQINATAHISAHNRGAPVEV